MNEQLSNVLLTTPFMEKLMDVMDKKAEEEEDRKEAEDRAEKERAKEKRKRGVDSDEELEDADDPKGKGKAKAKGKEKTASYDDEDDFEEPKHKKRKADGNAKPALPTSGFSLLSRPDLDLSKHYAHQETEIEEVKVELIDEYLAAETTLSEEQPWRTLSDFTIYDISDDNRSVQESLLMTECLCTSW
jgi:hypothetical protein